ncbi:hypothetical protein AB4Y99_20085 [Bosea sp. TAB14]
MRYSTLVAWAKQLGRNGGASLLKPPRRELRQKSNSRS